METNTETTETADDVAPEPETTDIEVAPEAEVEKPVERQTSRADRKRQRIDVEAANKARQEIEQTLAQERAERQRIEREVAEMRGQLQATQRTAEAKDQHAQTRDKIASLRKQAKAHLFFSAQAKDQGTAEKEWEEHQRLMDEADDLRDEMRAQSRWEKQRGELQQTGTDPALLEEKMYLGTKYPWIATDIEGRSLADGRFSALVASGRPPNRQTMEEAITYAAAKLGLGGQSAPTSSQRARYGGMPAGEGPGGGNERKTIKMGRHEEALAKAAYPHLEAKDAFKQWAKDISARQTDDE